LSVGWLFQWIHCRKNIENNIDNNIDNDTDNNGDKANSINLNTSTNASATKSKSSKSEEQSVYIVYCTKSSKVEDLMGKPRVSNNKNEDLIQW